MKVPVVKPRSSGTVPVGVATGPLLEDRTIVRVPWNRASVLHRAGSGHFENPIGIRAEAHSVTIDPSIVEAKQARLPKPVRRTAKQRAEALATELFKTGLQTQKEYGRTIWPGSVERELVRLGAQDKDLYGQVDALVGHFMVKAENKQKENDGKHTVRAWHGHFD